MISLSSTQEKIVQHDEGALLVVAGPGSGKTRVLTERIRRLLKKEGHFRILALTFTNKAANEMKERLSDIPDIDQRAFIGTMHKFCMEVLANRGKYIGLNKLPNIFELYQDRKQVLLEAVMNNPYLKTHLIDKVDPKGQDILLSEWLKMISDSKNKLLFPEMLDNKIYREIYEAYDSNLHASDVIDFDDLLLLTYKLLQERPKIADFYRRQYRYICIDEAQDLNEAQYQIINALCGIEYKNVMMVGDPNQAIFAWNGADTKYLMLFEKHFNAKKMVMKENFRSSKTIVSLAKRIDPYYEVQGYLPIEGSVDLIIGADEQEEANLIIDYIQKLITDGHPDIEGSIRLENFAILGRNRYVLSQIEKELERHGWPFYLNLSSQHESESDIIKDFELCLRIMSNPLDRLHLDMLLKRWNINRDNLQLNNNAINQESLINSLRTSVNKQNQRIVLDAIEAMELTETDFNFLGAIKLLKQLSNIEYNEQEKALILEDIDIWQTHWDSFLRSQQSTQHNLTLFLGQVALGTTQKTTQEGLALLTVHSSKGLEFDIVIVMGMTEGTFPDYRAEGTLLEEETRNMFVAITRSKRLICFSYPRSKKMPWGAIRRQRPSRYLKNLGLI